jgi:hypothetical protein
MPIIVAMFSINLFHPGHLLRVKNSGEIVEEKVARKSLD